MAPLPPFVILAAGILIVVGLIVVFRMNAFISLIVASVAVSLLAPGEFSAKIGRVAEAFGGTVGKIGIVIAMAAVVGACLIESGAADRIVRFFVGLFGEKRCEISLMSSGFLLSIPVFFDTVFYLLLPLARSMHRQTKKNYLLMVLCMGAGASITHSLVPPTPGPLILANTFGIDIGTMILGGLLVSVPTAFVIYFFIRHVTGRVRIPMRPLGQGESDPVPAPGQKPPGLFASLLPILYPLLAISGRTVISTLASDAGAGSALKGAESCLAVLGDANFAMMVSAAIALAVLVRQRKPGREQLKSIIENSLMSAGMIILITSAGGAFGEMLKTAQVGAAVQGLFMEGGRPAGGMGLLFTGFLIAFLLKFAQGSSTVSMITTSAMLATFLPTKEALGFHPVYVAAAIGFGAQCGNWMNDSGFWIFAKMGGFTEVETLKSWTVTVSVMAVIGLLITLLFATWIPLA